MVWSRMQNPTVERRSTVDEQEMRTTGMRDRSSSKSSTSSQGQLPITNRVLERKRLTKVGELVRTGKWRINLDAAGLGASGIRGWVLDPYHHVVSLTIWRLAAVIIVTYIGCWLIFAPIYLGLSNSCNLELYTFLDAMYYSVITMSTIGYGTQDMHFNDCPAGLLVIMAHTLLGTFVNAALVGTLYTKLSRSKNRTINICFSDKAVVRKVSGKLHFMFQLFDISGCTNDMIIESHVRCYVIRNTIGDNNEPVLFQQCAMRLSHPDDQSGSELMLTLPALVTHRIDAWSPLCPPRNSGICTDHDPFASFEFPEVLQRADDSDSGNRSGCRCEVCGESFETRSQLVKHRVTAAYNDVLCGFDKRTHCVKTGEVLPSIKALHQYHKFNEFGEVPDVSQAPDLNAVGSHLRYLPELRRQRREAEEADNDDSLPEELRPIVEGASSDSFVRDCWASNSDAAQSGDAVTADVEPNGGIKEREKGAPGSGNDKKPNGSEQSARGRPPSWRRTTPLLQKRKSVNFDAEWRSKESQAVEAYMKASCVEILVFVEGIDTYTSCTMQCRHSYSMQAGEIVFDHMFEPCVSHKNGDCVVDLNSFHKVRKITGEVESLRSTPSIS